MDKFLFFKASGKTLAVKKPVRVLEAYEFRRVNGKLVNALHLGDQLVDVGLLLGLEKTNQSKALLLSDGYGFLIDSIEDLGASDIASYIPLPKIVTQQKGSVIIGLVEIDGKSIPLLSKTPGKHLSIELDKEKSERVWI
jgi:hypothetical protein